MMVCSAAPGAAMMSFTRPIMIRNGVGPPGTIGANSSLWSWSPLKQAFLDHNSQKREAYRSAYAGFDPRIVADWTDSDIDRLMDNPLIVRNRKKIEASIGNAKAFLKISAEYGRFADWILELMGGRPLVNQWHQMDEIPARTALSEKIADKMKTRGFGFSVRLSSIPISRRPASLMIISPAAGGPVQKDNRRFSRIAANDIFNGLWDSESSPPADF
jgi:hypothetical protein